MLCDLRQSLRLWGGAQRSWGPHATCGDRVQVVWTERPFSFVLDVQVGMRHFHYARNKYHCPIINLDKLWTLVGEEVRRCALRSGTVGRGKTAGEQHGAGRGQGSVRGRRL